MLQITLNQDDKINQAHYIKNHSTNITYYIYSWLYLHFKTEGWGSNKMCHKIKYFLLLHYKQWRCSTYIIIIIKFLLWIIFSDVLELVYTDFRKTHFK